MLVKGAPDFNIIIIILRIPSFDIIPTGLLMFEYINVAQGTLRPIHNKNIKSIYEVYCEIKLNPSKPIAEYARH